MNDGPAPWHGDPLAEPRRSDPAVRFSHLKEDVTALAALGPEVQARVLARLDPRVLAAIGESTRVSWGSLGLNLALVEAVHAEAGQAGARALGKASFLASLDTFFRPMLAGVTSLFDLQPTIVLRFAPQAWKAVYRGCGELQVRRDGEARASVEARGFPAPLLREAFLHAFAGTFEAGLEICRKTGRVGWERRGDVAVYSISWQAR
jgi:hypothetical protein